MTMAMIPPTEVLAPMAVMITIAVVLVQFLIRQSTQQQRTIATHIVENTAMMKKLSVNMEARSVSLDKLSGLITEQTTVMREMIAYLKGRDT